MGWSKDKKNLHVFGVGDRLTVLDLLDLELAAEERPPYCDFTARVSRCGARTPEELHAPAVLIIR